MAAPNEYLSCGRCCTRLENVGVRLGGREILWGVNLHLHCGELTAIVGPNGAGKTTLLKVITGEVPYTGSVIFCPGGGTKRRPVIGYVPQRMDFDRDIPLSVLEFCAATLTRFPMWLGVSREMRQRIESNLDRFGVKHLLHAKMGGLSGGELQRVLLAVAMDPVPELLLLDEPVTAVDVEGMNLFYQQVSQLRKKHDLSIVLVSHDLELVERFADRIVFLNKTVVDCIEKKEASEQRACSLETEE